MRALLPRHTAAAAAGQSSRRADRCNVKRKVPVLALAQSNLEACWRRHADADTVPAAVLSLEAPGTSYPLRYDQSGNQKHTDGPQRDTPAPCRPVHTMYPAHRLHPHSTRFDTFRPSTTAHRLRHTRPLGPEMGAFLISSQHPSPAEKDER